MEMKKNLFLMVTLLSICSIAVRAQNLPVKKSKPYDAWVFGTGNTRSTVKGILYDVQDSSLRINNPYLDNLTPFHFQDINQIKIRRKKSVLKGALIGGGIGLLLPFIVNPGSGASSDLTPLVNTYLGFTLGLFGSAIGAGIGSIRITIPIGGNLNNFNTYKSKLNHFALIKNNDLTNKTVSDSHLNPKNTAISATKPLKKPESYEHVSFIGLVNGPSFIIGNWDQKTLINNRSYGAKTGYGSNLINIGYRLKDKLGISFAFFQNQYNAQSGDEKEFWVLIGFVAGPMYSYQLGKRFVFDLKPRIGYVGSALNTDENTQYQGKGLVLNPCISFRYNFARRWYAITESGYIFSHQKFNEISNNNIQSYNLGFGLGYRFK
jgi:hypothetical protein